MGMFEHNTGKRFPGAKWRTGLFRVSVWVAAGAVVLVTLTVANHKLVTRLLRLEYLDETTKQLQQRLTPVKEAVALSYEGGRPRASVIESLHGKGLVPEPSVDLPDHHPALVPFGVVSRLNPYPPVLFELSDSYARQRHPTSLLYLGDDDRYHQITWYGGESFTTPSLFVPKVPKSIYGGDYWVYYVVLLSHKGAKNVSDYSEPNLEWVGWYSFRGGSYNGFEEIGLHAGLLALELSAICVVAVFRWRKRNKGRQSRLSEA